MTIEETLLDWTPTLHVMAMGLVIALGPLAWIWLRKGKHSTDRRIHMLTVATLFLTFDLVVFGAFTRLTDSGLGCPDWPGCYGHMSPVGAAQDIAQAQSVMPDGPVTFAKAWIEMIHRYLATGVGVLILVLALFSSFDRKRHGRSVVWPWLTLVWVCVQGAFGALTVTLKLFPAIVTLHLMGGLGLLALLRWQQMTSPWYEAGHGGYAYLQTPTVGLRRAVKAVLALLTVQIALGGWVSTNYAVMACTDFPTCHGTWWPAMDFSSAFEVWRDLGHTASGALLPFEALVAIHYVHRLMAYVVVLAMLVLGLALWRRAMLAPAIAIWTLTMWQFLSGLSNVVLGWPLMGALAHTAGAAALVILLVGWWASARRCETLGYAANRRYFL